MPIKEASVETRYIKGLESFNASVFYTDELQETSPYDLAYSSVHGGYLPYLFIGYFREKESEDGKWFFSNARTHEEMKEAIIGKEFVGDVDYVYGQLVFSNSLLEKGEIKVLQVQLHNEFSEDEEKRKEVLNKLFSKVNPEHLCERVLCGQVSNDEWMYSRKTEDGSFKRIR